ncbi:metallophosphoesterase family protein [Halomarina halobia]|uniref:Metallophosphoesterase family protein n=1 Tax=Halomarina halobia TaxID=3033386 RepID=A0ABD6AAU7_9EURY|nr:metallophosphoesterase family protein [Halomarina sp. PSR21]
MRVGLLSDIHANAVALEAVLSAMPPVAALVCAGDVVGYGPRPAACVEALRAWTPDRAAVEASSEGAARGPPCESLVPVRGNHDRVLAAGASFDGGMAGAGLEHARRELTADQVAWLAALPETRRAFDGQIRVAHGHPSDPDRYVYPDLFSADLLDGERVLVLGHTHVQGVRRFPAGSVVNPGSVGQPRDGDPRAAYAVLDLDRERVDLRRVPYDVEAVERAVRDAGLPDGIAGRLRNGR